MRAKHKAAGARLFGAALIAAFLLGACPNPAGDPGDDEDGPDIPAVEPLGPGLYSFTGDSPPRETGENVAKIAVLPFTLNNALAVIDAEIEDPPEEPAPGTLPPRKNYLAIIDRDTLLQSWTLKGSFALTIRGHETERVIQLYNAGTSEEVPDQNTESLFTIRDGASLILEENLILAGSLANSAPLVLVDYYGALETHDSVTIQNNSAGGVRVRGRLARFAMSGGEISGCSIFNYDDEMYRRGSPGGAGVQILEGGSFVMKGGVIRNNRFENTEGSRYFAYGGGGVYRDSAAESSFIMEGGEITGNYSWRNGGGVFGGFTISGGSIRLNTCDDPDPLLKNISSVPATEGDNFVIEGWNEPHELFLSEKGDRADKPVTELETGSRLEFSARVTGVGTPSQNVDWSILEPHNPYTTLTDGVLVAGPGETASVLTVRASSAVDPEVRDERAITIRVYNEPRLRVKFERDQPAELFNALHEYIQAGHLEGGNPRGLRAGDYYDFPRLSIASDGVAAAVAGNNTFMDDGTGIFRVVVVGINSFKGINGNSESHIVFQFRNAAVSRRMNRTATNTGGYAGSELRAYLNGYFLPGLIASGVPQDLLWNPVRVLAKGGDETGTDTLADYLWLPSALEADALRLNELLGRAVNNAYLVREGETRANQALLEYYGSVEDADSAKSLLNRRNMAGNSGITWWLGSAGSGTSSFAAFGSRRTNVFDPEFNTSSATGHYGILPAFCVR
ncbi:MAG: DUF6273 domain-containing protein [Treponema sp.]|nr:DUF6273 domain-containing protein [Treponema sp.]